MWWNEFTFSTFSDRDVRGCCHLWCRLKHFVELVTANVKFNASWLIKFFIRQHDILGKLPGNCVKLGGWCASSNLRQDVTIMCCVPVCRPKINWIETLWYVSVLTLQMPYIFAWVCVLYNLKRCTHLSIMKCDWEALSNNILHGIYWPVLFWNSTVSVGSRIWLLVFPLNEQ